MFLSVLQLDIPEEPDFPVAAVAILFPVEISIGELFHEKPS